MMPFETRHLIFENGIYFGYPLCCIKEFIKDIEEGGEPPVKRVKNIKNIDGSFCPCRKHTQEIYEGKIKQEDLIDGRVCPHPFPIRNKNDISER
jgi:hypothetical protein